jgi:hypothetical protein
MPETRLYTASVWNRHHGNMEQQKQSGTKRYDVLEVLRDAENWKELGTEFSEKGTEIQKGEDCSGSALQK